MNTTGYSATFKDMDTTLVHTVTVSTQHTNEAAKEIRAQGFDRISIYTIKAA